MVAINFQVRAKKFQDSTREYIEEKVNRLEKLLKKYEVFTVKIDPIANAKARNTQYRMEITVKMPKAFVKVEGKGFNINKIFDSLVEPITKKLNRYHSQEERWSKHKEWKMLQVIPEPMLEETETLTITEFEPRIRRKAYNDDTPLHPAEAIEKMELLGNSCFLFRNIENNRYAMVCKQEDGDYTLVQPE